MTQPQPNDRVFYILRHGSCAGQSRAASVRAANGLDCTLEVIVDPRRDGLGWDGKPYFAQAEYAEEKLHILGTWHWPRDDVRTREEDKAVMDVEEDEATKFADKMIGEGKADQKERDEIISGFRSSIEDDFKLQPELVPIPMIGEPIGEEPLPSMSVTVSDEASGKDGAK